MDPEPNQGAKAQGSAASSAAAAGDGDAAPASTPRRSRAPKARVREDSGTFPNNVRKLRQAAMMSKAELARRAGVSPLTIDRVEAGCPCRMDTKRKILEALGLQPSAAKDVFPDVDLG
jgi:DNA-binding XRE family transcriptional regulator